jgi:hypothetical protein
VRKCDGVWMGRGWARDGMGSVARRTHGEERERERESERHFLHLFLFKRPVRVRRPSNGQGRNSTPSATSSLPQLTRAGGNRVGIRSSLLSLFLSPTILFLSIQLNPSHHRGFLSGHTDWQTITNTLSLAPRSHPSIH